MILGGSWAAAAVHLGSLALVWSLPGLQRELRWRFAFYFLVPAWYCVTVGAAHAGILPPRFMNLSQFVTGYSGALLLWLTLGLLHPDRPLPKRMWLTLLGGLPATILATTVLLSPEPEVLLSAFYKRQFDQQPVLTALWSLHGVQLIGFIFATAAVAADGIRSAHDNLTWLRAIWAAGPIASLAFATVVSVVLPLTPYGPNWSGFGPMVSTVMAVTAIGAAQFSARQHRDLLRERSHMSRYLPREVVQRIATGDQRLELGGEQAVATVLFTDLRGFTSLSEQLTPSEVVALLNEHLGVLSDVVLQHGGMVDKFIGDALLAVFGVPDGEDDAERAVACAVAMLAAVQQANAVRRAEGRPELKIGIGLARGPLVHGNIGSPARMEYTVIGDTVNVASRVESLTKELGVELLLTGEVVSACADASRFVTVDERTLRGRREATQLFTVG